MPTVSKIIAFYRNEEIQAAARAFGELHEGKKAMFEIQSMVPDYLALTAVMARVLKTSGLIEEEQRDLEEEMDPISGASPYCFLALPGMKRDLSLPWLLAGLDVDVENSVEGVAALMKFRETESGVRKLDNLALIWETGKIYAAMQSQVYSTCNDVAEEMLAKMLMGIFENLSEDSEVKAAMAEAKGATKQ